MHARNAEHEKLPTQISNIKLKKYLHNFDIHHLQTMPSFTKSSVIFEKCSSNTSLSLHV